MSEFAEPPRTLLRQDPTMAYSKGEQHPSSDMSGRIRLENRETSFVSGTHWTAILDGIAELKDRFEDSEEQSCSNSEMELWQSPTERPTLLFGANTYATKHEILSSIPSRAVANKLVSSFFNAMDMAPVVVHGPSFLKEYEKFWKNPSATSVMGVGLLFAIMCLAMQFQSHRVDECHVMGPHPQSGQDNQHLVRLYQEKTAQCLVLGKYTKCVPYTIQTLILYFTTEHFQSEDTQLGNWILLGVIVRIAMRMGYHCDAGHSSQITPFQGEMRRRAWAILVQLDLVTSSQIGLPRMIKEAESDTAEPRNLFDKDFDDDTVVLPISRPETDLTPMLYVIVKNRIMSVLGRISDLNISTRPTSYAEVIELDTVIHKVRNAVPPSLQTQPTTKSLLDNPEVVMQRAYIALLLFKVQCILHHQYLVPAHSDSQYNYSRQSCIDAALQMLQLQSTLNQETQPGGRLYQYKWRVSSLVNHDFFLAATVLCLELDRDILVGSPHQSNDSATEVARRTTIMQALHESYRIWLQSSRSSWEAQKAAQALEIMLGKEKRAKAPERNRNSCGLSKSAIENLQLQSLSSHSDPESVSDQLSQHHINPIALMSQHSSTLIQSHVPVPSSVGFASDGEYAESVDRFNAVRDEFLMHKSIQLTYI
ncbi:MAG: hypothetical protein Q9225_000810 [Loekoesia sp. 1 TL-2023]